jgi:nucleotide-binding universal stress UspA family protein
MLQTIIVLFDNWQLSDGVVAHAAALAEPLSSKVILTGVMSGGENGNSEEFIDPVIWSVTKSEFEVTLNQYAQYLRGRNIETDIDIIKSSWAEGVVRYAVSADCDLMVLPYDGDQPSQLIQSLLKHTHIPVLLARADQLEPTFKDILIPLDGSQRAESSLNLAASIARALGARLHLAHVVQQPEMPRRTTVSVEDMEIAQQLVDRNAKEARRYLDQIATNLAVDVETHVLIDKKVTSSLHNLIAQEGIDLLILSAHGYTGEPQWPFGMVAENLVRHSKIPTIIVQDLPALLSNTQSEPIRIPNGAH